MKRFLCEFAHDFGVMLAYIVGVIFLMFMLYPYDLGWATDPVNQPLIAGGLRHLCYTFWTTIGFVFVVLNVKGLREMWKNGHQDR